MKSLMTLAIAIILFVTCIQNRAYGDTKVNRARLDIKRLEQAADAYWLKTGEWPSSLAILSEGFPDGSPAVLKDPSAIIDPWGQAYHYDPKRLHPKTGKPLIWSNGPPAESNFKIANWDEESTYKPPIEIPWLAIAVLTGIVVLSVGCICLPRSEKPLLRNPQALSGWLLVVLILAAVAYYFCYVPYTAML